MAERQTALSETSKFSSNHSHLKLSHRDMQEMLSIQRNCIQHNKQMQVQKSSTHTTWQCIHTQTDHRKITFTINTQQQKF